MHKVTIGITMGDRHRGILPAAPTSTIQSRDVLEVCLRPLYEDTTLTSFVIKALFFILSLFTIINRFRAMVAKIDRMIVNALDNTDAKTDEFALSLTYNNHSNNKYLFCKNDLNLHHQNLMQQNDWYFRQWLKQVISETPSLTATLHGATCGNLLCTYQI